MSVTFELDMTNTGKLNQDSSHCHDILSPILMTLIAYHVRLLRAWSLIDLTPVSDKRVAAV